MILVKTLQKDLINITDLAGVSKEDRTIKVHLRHDNKTYFTINFKQTDYNIDKFLEKFYDAILEASKFGGIIDIEDLIIDTITDCEEEGEEEGK